MKKDYDTIKILLVDDEPDALDMLESLLANEKGVRVVGKATNRYDAIRKMIGQDTDVIFQDIQMGETDGLTMVDEYRKHHFNGAIVFVTAYAQYAIEAIKKAAFDYLLKPVDPEDLEALILRLLSERSHHADSDREKEKKLKIPTRTGFLLLNTDEIIFCKADGNYTEISTIANAPIITSLNLGKIEVLLPSNKFFRISRSVIINTRFLTTVNKGEKICLLKAGDHKYKLHISTEKIKELEGVM